MDLVYNVDSVVSGGLYITITSFYSGYSPSHTIGVAINDGGPNPPGGTGQYTGVMNKIFGPQGVSTFYSWYDLNGYDPPPDIVANNHTTISIFRSSTPDNFEATYSTGPDINGNGFFPWPAQGGAPCFVAASNILTPTGYKSAADIKNGDLLMTADGRQVPVKSYSFTVEKADKESAPFFIPKNSISMGCPHADLRLSPWHAFQMKKGLWMKPMSAFELGMPVKQYDLGKPATYYHFEAPDYFKDNFVCEGTVVESFGGLQTKDMKGRVYTYNANLKGYTRAAAKSVSKTIMM